MQRILFTAICFGWMAIIFTGTSATGHAQILSLDFNDRPGGAGETAPGFDEFLLTGFPHTQSFNGITVELNQHGASGLNDRFRGGLSSSGSFDQEVLLQDFIFNDNTSSPTEGFDIKISGLNPNAFYDFSLWAYDFGTDNPSGNPNRIANWNANGTTVLNDITSVGPPPTDNDAYRHTFMVAADGAGEILLETREAGTHTGALINGLQLDLTPPPIVSTWNIDASESWQNHANWDNNAVPGSRNQHAIFGPAITASRVVNLESNASLSRLEFNNPHKYVVFGPSQFSVDLTTDTLANTPTVGVVQGDHQLQAVVNLRDDTAIDVSSGASLTFDHALHLNGNTLTKKGPGTALINNSQNSVGGAVVVEAGILGGTGTVGGILTANSGTTVAPGTTYGTLSVEASYVQNAGSTLQIELGGTDKGHTYDVLDVAGTLIAGGTLQVVLDGFTPSGGNQFDILDFGFLTGSFALTLPEGVNWDTSQLLTTGVLSVATGSLDGDFNEDGIVNAADYTIWYDNMGSNTMLPNDNGLGGPVGQAHYVLWKNNFGTANGNAAAVPEPASLSLCLLASAVLFLPAFLRRAYRIV